MQGAGGDRYDVQRESVCGIASGAEWADGLMPPTEAESRHVPPSCNAYGKKRKGALPPKLESEIGRF